MLCHVKYRNSAIIGSQWYVVYHVDADTFHDAEIKVKRAIAVKLSVPVSWIDCRAYRADAKSVWSAK